MNWAKVVAGNTVSTSKTIIESVKPKEDSMKPFLIDIGANLAHKSFANSLESILLSSYEKGVKTIVITGTSVSASKSAIKLCRLYQNKPNYPKLYCTVGVHPHDAQRAFNGKLEMLLRSLIKENQDIVVAVGEAGLDYNRNFSEPAVQRTVFELQCQLAVDLQMPMFWHEREAFTDFLDIVQKYPLKGVVHCFTGTKEELKKYTELGCYIGITGFITDPRRASKLRDCIDLIPADKLMIETDAPFMTPKNMPQKARNNLPEYLTFVAKDIAELRNTSIEEFTKQVYDTTSEFFRI